MVWSVWVKISHTVVNGASLVNFDGFAPASQWEELSAGLRVPPSAKSTGAGTRRVSRRALQLLSNFSIPDLSAAISASVSLMVGRRKSGNAPPCCLAAPSGEQAAVAALFRREESGGSPCSSSGARTSSWTWSTQARETWDGMLQQGRQISLARFLQDGRLRILADKNTQQQIQFNRALSSGAEVSSPTSMRSGELLIA